MTGGRLQSTMWVWAAAALMACLIAATQGPTLAASWHSNRSNLVVAQCFVNAVSPACGVASLSAVHDPDSGLCKPADAHRLDCTSGVERNLAAAAVAFGDLRTARKALETLVSSCPEDPLSWYWLGAAYEAEGSWAKAISPWRRVGARVALQRLGDRLAKRHMWGEALEAYRAAVHLDSANCVYQIRLGTAEWWARRDLRAAMEHMQHAMNLCPYVVDGYVAAGRVLIEAKNYTEAERMAILGREVDPSSELPLTLLALCQLRQNNPGLALPYLEEGLRLNPASAEAYALKGSAYIQLGQFAQAVTDLERAIDLGPAQAWHYETLGVAYEQLGDVASAIGAYRQALDLEPARQGARDRLVRLQEQE